MSSKKDKLFCERNPFFYKISTHKERIKRHLKNFSSKSTFAKTMKEEQLKYVVSDFETHLIKRAPGVDLELQQNKLINTALACKQINGILIRPGEEFSFWKTVGNTTKRKGYMDGRVINQGKLEPGIGGGLCNLGNSIHKLVILSPLTTTEFHSHSDALSPDEGPRVPLSAGTSIHYNYVDYRFKNNTDQTFQLVLWVEGEDLHGELRCEKEIPNEYRIIEENHRFEKDGDDYYRRSKIYKITTDKKTGETISKDLIWDNNSIVMFDHDLIPKDQIKNDLQ